MISFYKKYWRTVFDIGLIVLTVYLIMLAFSHLWKIAAPIFLAVVIFYIIEPLAKFLHRGKIKKSFASAVSILVFVLIALALVTTAGVIFVAQISNLIAKIPVYSEILKNQIILLTDMLQEKINTLPPDITTKVEEYTGKATEQSAVFITWLLSNLLTFLTSFSTFIINFSIGVILAYFLSVEIETWNRIAKTKTPKTFKTAFYFLKENVLKGLVSYIKAQLKLITITFIIVLAGLLVLNVTNSFSIALLSGLFDLLPLLGVSTLFIPWIIYLFIVGQTKLGISLSVLLGVILATRQFLEPKITGDSLGVSAFTMLSFMIISLSLFGVAGLILSPILIILIKSLYEQGYLQQWIRVPEEEYDP
ncbi:sporulation integral membrane protein YtvI [Ferviditalea candida]|uniref:Sporulation integral membrane protein YtvI n=1 Tax=Ferviditalea candida TaxID=3108399 RepID=A0ABU5ZI34_9BACL|nr:sporulation integral membrane protein YtvI [Paenibacillaceae bacterium T2]